MKQQKNDEHLHKLLTQEHRDFLHGKTIQLISRLAVEHGF